MEYTIRVKRSITAGKLFMKAAGLFFIIFGLAMSLFTFFISLIGVFLGAGMIHGSYKTELVVCPACGINNELHTSKSKMKCRNCLVTSKVIYSKK